MTDDERGPDDRQPEGAEPDGAAADGAAPDDASDWLAAQFGEDDDDAQAAAADATDREPSQAVDTEPGLRPDAEPAPGPDAATRALPTQPAAGPSADDDLPPIVPAFVVPAAPTGETDVPRSSGHPMALDLSQLKGSVEAPEPPAATDETVPPVEPATAAPATAPADAPADDDGADSGPAAPPVFSPPADEPARPAGEPGPFTALIASAPVAPAPSVFDWDALPARDAQPEPVTPSATEPEPVEALVDDDGHEEARPEPDAPTRAVEAVAPAAAVPETAPDEEPTPEPEPEPELEPASEPEPEVEPASEPEPGPGAAEAPRLASEPVETDPAPPSTPAAGSAAAAGQGDPWWVEEHHEMTRRERRLAEAAAAAAAAAAASASAASPTSPPAARPASEPTFTELLGISVPDREQGDDESPADVPGDGAADAGRHDPVEESSAGSWSLSSLDDEPHASAIAAEGEADDSTDLSDTPLDDVPDDDVSDEHLARAEAAPRPEAPAPTSAFPPPYRPAPAAVTPASPLATAPAALGAERPRTTPSAPGELPGLSVARPEVGPTLTTTFPVVAAGEPYGGAPGGGRPEGIAGWSRNRKLLLGAAAVLVVVLALLALFFLSRSLFAGAPEPTTEPAAATTQTVVAAPAEAAADVATGPLSPGVHAWSDLQGGECFATFENAWQQEYDVVDCGAPHAAQLASTGTLPGDAAAAFPGADTLQNQMTVLCTSATALDLGAAASYADLQFSASYPTTSDEWAAGARTYSCFVDRSGGEALATSLAPTAG